MVASTEAVAGTLSAEQVQFYRANGYLVVRGLLSAIEIAEIRQTFMDAAKDGPVPGLSETTRQATGAFASTDPLARYPRMMHPHRHPDRPVGTLAMRTMLDPRIGAVLRDLFDDEPIAAQSMFYFKPPGARGQDFHQDNFYLRVKPGTCLAAWVAVDDADADNGAMMVVPGTGDMELACPERSDTTRFFTDHHVPIPAGREPVMPDLKAGDCLFFNGSLIHGSYPNTSADRFRRSFICHYVPRSCEEVSHYYRPLLSFAGQETTRAEATGGGPCGEATEVKGPH